MKNNFETVLIMQGGGSLGAYECGVFRTLCENNIHFDIISGTSIGAINALIIASHDSKPEEKLEDFWLELSENSASPYFSDEIRPFYAAFHSSVYGNPKIFSLKSNPMRLMLDACTSSNLYTLNPLKKTLEKFVDLKKINSKKSKTRLILTAINIQNAQSEIFDSHHTEITLDHALATVGYPFYGIEWTKINDKYLWDGSLMSNTPLREVIKSSPKLDKDVYLVSLFPRKHKHLPENMFEVWHRARDIMHTDKTQHNVHMSKIFSRQLILLKQMYSILEDVELSDDLKQKFNSLKSEYQKIAEQRGAIIKKITRIERQEESHFLLEDADFSEITIKNLIRQGKQDAQKALNMGKTQ